MHRFKKSFDPARYLRFGILITGAALVAGAVVAASIAVGASRMLSSSATTGATASPSPTATPWAMATIFRDAATNNSFSIQLQNGRPDTGRFDYFVTGQGDYIGTAILSNDGGPGNLKVSENLSDNSTALFVPVGGDARTTVQIRLEGQVVNSGSGLTLNIWINGAQTSFATGNADPTQAAALAQQAIASLSRKDWATFYNLLAPEVQSGFGGSQLAFSQSVSTADGNIVAASLTGTGTSSSSGGYSYFSQGVSITVSTASGTAAYRTTIYLVYENGKWYVLGTDPPSPR